MSESLSKNLNLLMAEIRINAEELSRRINIPASTIKKIRNNENANPTISTLIPMAKYFAISVSQLIGEEPISDSRIKGSYKLNPACFNYIPSISWQDAIIWPSSKIEVNKNISTEHVYSKNTFALIVEEENWENLPKETVLIIDPEVKATHRDFAIVYKEGQSHPTLKQILLDEDRTYLKPVIDLYQIITLTEQHRFLGVVVEYKKSLKKFV